MSNVPDASQEELTLPGLVRAAARKAKPPQVNPPSRPAEVDPVARVLVDLPLAHLDRPFDYQVPASMADDAVPGARVKVRFAGQEVDGFLVARTAESTHPGHLAPLRRVVSAEPVLSPEVAELTGEVAARWAGTRSDVLRLAIPPRHAAVEKRPIEASGPLPPVGSDAGWGAYDAGAGLLAALSTGEGASRVLWSCLPGDDWAVLL
ncbi:MAG: primosome assembly protein PriA, partial [Actinomycetota bacterium]|nr:primosome assembly protein PriA [Actinomycetota bacterium]